MLTCIAEFCGLAIESEAGELIQEQDLAKGSIVKTSKVFFFSGVATLSVLCKGSRSVTLSAVSAH